MAFLLDGIRIPSFRHRWNPDEDMPSLMWNLHCGWPQTVKAGQRGTLRQAVFDGAERAGIEVWMAWRVFRALVLCGFLQPVRLDGGRYVVGYRKRSWTHVPRFEKLARRDRQAEAAR